jgi:hypothetical protein
LRVVLVQRHGDLLGELARNATQRVDLGELFKSLLGIGGQLGDLGLPVCVGTSKAPLLDLVASQRLLEDPAGQEGIAEPGRL